MDVVRLKEEEFNLNTVNRYLALYAKGGKIGTIYRFGL